MIHDLVRGAQPRIMLLSPTQSPSRASEGRSRERSRRSKRTNHGLHGQQLYRCQSDIEPENVYVVLTDGKRRTSYIISMYMMV